MSEPKWRYFKGRMHGLKSKLIDFINELSSVEPCPWDLHSFSDETLIDFLRDLIKEKEQLVADAELDA